MRSLLYMPGWLGVVLIGLVAGCDRSSTPQPNGAAGSDGADRDTASVRFTDVTKQAGLGDFRHYTGAYGEMWMPETMGAGCGFIDYDGDGRLDIILVSGDVWPASEERSPPALRLYRNNADGTFTEQTSEAGLADHSAYGFGITVADYDNDGDPDIYLTTLQHNLLFRNDDGAFTEVGRTAGVDGLEKWSTAAVFFDADRDGWPDLFVGNYVDWSPDVGLWCSIDGENKSYCTPELYEGISGRFYLNNGDGTFTDRTAEVGFTGAPGKTLGVAELDYNGDGWSDLAVANDKERNLLFQNRGDGTFDEVGMPSGIAFDEQGKARAGMGIDAGDVGNDGRVSIFVGNFSNEMIGVFRQIDHDLFIDRASASRIGHPSVLTLTFGLFLFDVDLDGYLDLLAANGHVEDDVERVQDRVTYRQSVQLFMNRGDGTFELEKPSTGPLTSPLVARGAAYGDYDRDGDLDVLVTENGGSVHLWQNQVMETSEPRPHYLRVHLVGQSSNHDGLGARIIAAVGEERMERRIRTGSSYLSQSETVATFGLGGASSVDTLTVVWPSGRVDRYREVEADHTIRLRERTHEPA